ncbi:MAG TPA: GMC family oxidoreductase [Gemmatimonadales bacterium]|nr:GMC family oxidoreductase [Gemmatimonadales bacterium]
MARFAPSDPVDFVVVGSGGAGGILAKELSTRGMSVVVLEQGPHVGPLDFHHDEFKHFTLAAYQNQRQLQPQMFKAGPDAEAQPRMAVMYHRMVGGGSMCFTANYRRFRPLDFNERTRLGPIAGTGFADWPIGYDDLEPYYTRAEWELGVSGEPGPFDPPRSRPYPMPPLPVKSSGVLFERGARAIGLHPQPAQMAILSQPFQDRIPCQQCGYCIGFPCEHRAKSATLYTVLPVALASGRCELRTECFVAQVETDDRGRVSGVVYFDSQKVQQRQRAKAVVLCCNGAETPHLLLNSGNNRFPQGLANSSGAVGRHLMFNSNAIVTAQFEHPLNDWKGAMVTRIALDFYDTDPARGFYGGGALDGRFFGYPLVYAMRGAPPGTPKWGAGFKQALRDGYCNQMDVLCEGTSLPLETNRIELDPDLKDAWGLPAMRVTYRDHPDDLATVGFLQTKALALLEAAGATRTWARPPAPQNFGVHLLGTCRMGNDPATSVVDSDHRAHDVPNLFICDGSSLVSSGRGQPTATIQALAFRAGERIAELAKKGQI